MGDRRYFGTDGIRGTVGVWPISADFVLRLGRAAGEVLVAAGGDGSILIGKDTRRSGYMFESALEAGLIAAGADVRLLGPMPTPAVAMLTRQAGASAGIVISASHNPHFDNGIKFFSAQGEKLSDELERAIESAIDAPFATVKPERLGKARRMADAAERSLGFCRATVPPELSLTGLRVVVDCAHGANYQLAPRLLTDLGAVVLPLAVAPDGLNINLDCGSTHPQAMCREVLARGADLGIAFDGDGDRLVLADRSGALVDGDDILHLRACDGPAPGRLRGPVVGTLMSNYGLEQSLTRRGIAFRRAAVGDRFVHQMLVGQGGVLGGEASGHVLCLDRASTGDALVCALQVLEVLVRRCEGLDRLAGGWSRLPQKTVNVRVAAGSSPMAHALVERARAEAEQSLAGRGRLVLRASGTEPVIRLTVEADDSMLVDAVLGRLAAAVSAAANSEPP
ncbi:MAG: phosphoglucosamine mutase [Pseudomonadota bacterium]